MAPVFIMSFVGFSLVLLLRGLRRAGHMYQYPFPPPTAMWRSASGQMCSAAPVCEGSATVIYEALMAGLAVVTTPNAGSIVMDGESGRIVGVGDVDGLAAALQAYIDDPALLEAHGAGAGALRSYADLERYRDDLTTAVVGPLTAGHAIRRAKADIA